MSYLIQQKKKKARAAAAGDEPVGPGGDEISILIGEANNKLSAAKAEPNARVANLPVFLLLGETGSTKTSVMLHSGLDPELLAGQFQQNENVVPTRSAKIWFTRRSEFVGGRRQAARR